MSVPPAELIKRKANEAFKKRDYHVANTLYSHAMSLDGDNPLYVLNRAMSNLKLANWQEAENDVTRALSLSPNDATLAQKGLFRRSWARKAKGDQEGAREDLEAFVARGGKQADAAALADPVAADALLAPLAVSPNAQANEAFEVKDSGSGKGVFAVRTFHRGDMIFAEEPLFSVPEYGDFRAKWPAILSAVEKLSPSDLVQFLSLHNNLLLHDDLRGGNIFIGIYFTNVLPGGLCITSSRFNHSCLPNARYSWHAESGQMRFFALTDIAVGEEISVSYLISKKVFGNTRDERRRLIREGFDFACSCAACTLDGAALKASDARRRKAFTLWEAMVQHDPINQAQRVVNDAVQAIRLLKEEGYAALADHFACDAAAFCAMHSDWESAKYWAKYAYDNRCAEFGADHEDSRDSKVFWDDPRKCPQAGMCSGQKFPQRV
ncbi:SET domain-containing protein [Mycena sanguinolenta]|uniref:SET domain-containing protein n=1 Tax=Mycena sanguinolenta TaxID=230812 RepID=A0A8H6ZI05_9AGAR|nr:SET domain-containing protein [Mycena sanguinolenta]